VPDVKAVFKTKLIGASGKVIITAPDPTDETIELPNALVAMI